ncbi:MAG TPA: hypothetical protein VFN49_10570 [Candidatus Aquilonibacter sp.]|nr:hypothetical protein [Candidatus Aquilonibacter sp.]
MNRALATLSLAASALFLPTAVSAQSVALAASSGELRVPVVPVAPPINGTLSSPIWKQAAVARLTYDLHTHAAAAEPTTAYVLSDGKALYVGFEATQTRTPILTSQHTNDVGQDTDDEVQVNLWPAGSTGFAYQFISTPNGTHYQNSSENLAYEPQWESAGHIDGDRFTVTMRIPLTVMRNEKKGQWLVQLSRFEPTTGSLYLYHGTTSTSGTGDVTAAEPLRGVPVTNVRPQARFAAYGLGQIGAPSAGGNTSRVGLDFSVPITSGTSFVGTIHPDFSNVENDQQSISPTAFRRYLQETRPFFTQGAGAYNYMECDECLGIGNLYTPNIPTPRSGYAVEGNEGRFLFGGFTAIGADGRNDNAQSVVLRNSKRTFFASLQRVGVTMPGFSDSSEFFSTKWSDTKHKFLFANLASESGTNVTDPSKAKMAMIGGGWFGANTFLGGNIMRMGSQYAPYDGFVSFNDAAGYGVFRSQNWNPHGGAIKSVNLSASIDRYQGTQGGFDNTDQGVSLSITTKTLWNLQTQTGAAYALLNSVFTPLTQNQTSLTYRYGTSTPTQIAYATGRYGDGRLDAWYRNTAFKVGQRFIVTLELDDTRQYVDNGTANIQWLERASVSMQTGRDSSFALGLRRFVGTPPQFSNGACDGLCSNVSFAYHKRFGKRELYVAYGSPASLYTTPQFLVKIIDYIGADKGT